MLESLESTAIFALLPGSLATDLISMIPSYISGTSCRNNLLISSGRVLVRKIWGPRVSSLTSYIRARTRSPFLKVSLGKDSSRRNMASPRPKSTTTLPYSVRFTRPLTISPARSLYSSYCCARSASLTRWAMTCLAAWAATRPKSIGGRASVTSVPIFASGSQPNAASSPNWVASSSTSSTT